MITDEQIDSLLVRLQSVAHDRRIATDTATSLCSVALPPCTLPDLAEVESQSRINLPRLMKRIYTEVGDGGFGPGNGLLPIAEIQSEYDGLRRSDRARKWPQNMLPIVDDGCGAFVCLYLSDEDDSPPVVTYTLNLNNEDTTRRFLRDQPYLGVGFIPTGKSLLRWLVEWLDSQSSKK